MAKNELPVLSLDMAEEWEKKEPFRFEYTVPTYDWYDTVKVEIKPEDYYYFRIERRFGPSWWLVGKNPPDRGAEDYRWTEKTIGELSEHNLARFVEWAKDGCRGSRIIAVSAISGSFDILREIEKLLTAIGGKHGTE